MLSGAFSVYLAKLEVKKGPYTQVFLEPLGMPTSLQGLQTLLFLSGDTAESLVSRETVDRLATMSPEPEIQGFYDALIDLESAYKDGEPIPPFIQELLFEASKLKLFSP